MRHFTHQHAGSTVDEPTCSLFVAIERVTFTTPTSGGLRRVGARVCNRCGQPARPIAADAVAVDPFSPRLTCSSGSLSWNCHLTSQHGFARFQPTLCCTSPRAAATSCSAAPRLASTARLPPGSSLPCSLSRRARLFVGQGAPSHFLCRRASLQLGALCGPHRTRPLVRGTSLTC